MIQKKRNGIQSIDVGFSILNILINSSSPLPLKVISERSGLSPSKIHSYLVSFLDLNIVEQNENTGFYGLGSYCLKLGLGYLDQVDLLSSAKPIMFNLAANIGHTVFLGVWGNRGPTIISRVDGPQSHIIFDFRIGSVLPLLSSALGKNFAANLPENFVRPFLIEEIEKFGKSKFVPDSLSEVYMILDEIRSNGISRCRSTLLSDYTAISVPLFDFSNTMFAGLTIMGRIDSLDDRYEGEPAKLLKEAGLKISRTRGYQM